MAGTSFLNALAGLPWVRRAADTVLVRYAHTRTLALDRLDAAKVQHDMLDSLVRRARETKFGKDHKFDDIFSVADFQARVPLREYEYFWETYWKPVYPRLDDVTWPGHIPYYALSSGTTSGTTKYIPVSYEMIRSNRKAAFTTLALFRHAHPTAAILTGKFFFLGGSTDLRRQEDGSLAGDLSGIAAKEAPELLRAYTYPPLELSLLSDWNEKITRLAEGAARENITAISGVPAWLQRLFERVKAVTGKKTLAEVWPNLRLVVHGGTKFDPFRDLFVREIGSDRVHFCEVYPASEGFVAAEDPRYGLLRIIPDHGVFFEFVPVSELGRDRPTRHTLANVEVGVQYAVAVTSCAGLWAYLLGDTVVFERRHPPLIRFTGRTKYFLSAFGEHLISEEVERAVAEAGRRCGVYPIDFHVGPVFPPDPARAGYHLYLIEFADRVPDLHEFAWIIDEVLTRLNEDYGPHRVGDLAMGMPVVRAVRRGGFDEWMKSRGRYGGQNKVPRMDNSGETTRSLVQWLEDHGFLEPSVP